MTDPILVPTGALDGIDVGVSVSESADLPRLGLDPRHAQLALGEIARAVLVAGGRLVYGGRLTGVQNYTDVLIDEVQRYSLTRRSFTLCLALPEHSKLSTAELKKVNQGFSTWGELITLDAAGKPTSWRADRDPSGAAIPESDQPAAFTALRAYLTAHTHARVLAGGKLAGYQGAMPGLVEEATMAVRARQPLYFAGGFGGAATAIAKALGVDEFAWLPPDMPQGHDDAQVRASLEKLKNEAEEAGWSIDSNGLSDDENRMLAASHRPGEIASLVVSGLARAFPTERD